MARGHQKIQSQAKAQEKANKMKKQAGHSANDQKKAAQKALVISCLVCKVGLKKDRFFLNLAKIRRKISKNQNKISVTNAGSKDLQTTLRKQASEE